MRIQEQLFRHSETMLKILIINIIQKFICIAIKVYQKATLKLKALISVVLTFQLQPTQKKFAKIIFQFQIHLGQVPKNVLSNNTISIKIGMFPWIFKHTTPRRFHSGMLMIPSSSIKQVILMQSCIINPVEQCNAQLEHTAKEKKMPQFGFVSNQDKDFPNAHADHLVILKERSISMSKITKTIHSHLV